MAPLSRLALGILSLAIGALAPAAGSAEGSEGAPAAEAPAAASAADPAAAGPPPLPWQHGPMKAPIGSLAEIDLPEGYVFLDEPGTLELLELTGNIAGGSELATVAKADDSNWFVIFEWDGMGWVDDSDRDELDPEALLSSLREGNEAANEQRSERGFSTFEIVGWNEPPHYDEKTNNLTWAIEGKSDGVVTLNRMVKLLGRRGVMSATLVSSPEQLAAAKTDVDLLLGGYRFQQGHTYAEYLPGTDKAAQIGLGALVVGGGAAALVKSGLLAKLWKPIAAGLVAIFAGLRRLFAGRSSTDAPAA